MKILKIDLILIIRNTLKEIDDLNDMNKDGLVKFIMTKLLLQN